MKTRATLELFHLLTPAEQGERIRKLAAEGWLDHDIARLTRLHVDQVRQAIWKTDSDNTQEKPA